MKSNISLGELRIHNWCHTESLLTTTFCGRAEMIASLNNAVRFSLTCNITCWILMDLFVWKQDWRFSFTSLVNFVNERVRENIYNRFIITTRDLNDVYCSINNQLLLVFFHYWYLIPFPHHSSSPKLKKWFLTV